MSRWLRELQGRCLVAGTRKRKREGESGTDSLDAVGRSWLSAASERLADVFLRGAAATAPLASFARCPDGGADTCDTDFFVGYVFQAFQRGNA